MVMTVRRGWSLGDVQQRVFFYKRHNRAQPGVEGRREGSAHARMTMLLFLKAFKSLTLAGKRNDKEGRASDKEMDIKELAQDARERWSRYCLSQQHGVFSGYNQYDARTFFSF